MNYEIKNPRTRDQSQYIDVDIRFIESDDTYGEWMPHTILANDERFQSIANGSLGAVVQEAPIRDVPAKLDETLAKGVEWTDRDGVSYSLKADNLKDRERIASAAIRLNINNTLPKNKSVFDYPDINNVMVSIPKEDVQDVAMLIQDYVEECHDNYQHLLSDTTLDINSGWPS